MCVALEGIQRAPSTLQLQAGGGGGGEEGGREGGAAAAEAALPSVGHHVCAGPLQLRPRLFPQVQVRRRRAVLSRAGHVCAAGPPLALTRAPAAAAAAEAELHRPQVSDLCLSCLVLFGRCLPVETLLPQAQPRGGAS